MPSKSRSETVQFTAVIPDCRMTSDDLRAGRGLGIEKRVAKRIHHDSVFVECGDIDRCTRTRPGEQVTSEECCGTQLENRDVKFAAIQGAAPPGQNRNRDYITWRRYVSGVRSCGLPIMGCPELTREEHGFFMLQPPMAGPLLPESEATR